MHCLRWKVKASTMIIHIFRSFLFILLIKWKAKCTALSLRQWIYRFWNMILIFIRYWNQSLPFWNMLRTHWKIERECANLKAKQAKPKQKWMNRNTIQWEQFFFHSRGWWSENMTATVHKPYGIWFNLRYIFYVHRPNDAVLPIQFVEKCKRNPATISKRREKKTHTHIYTHVRTKCASCQRIPQWLMNILYRYIFLSHSIQSDSISLIVLFGIQ